jgi:hypothetical protein
LKAKKWIPYDNGETRRKIRQTNTGVPNKNHMLSIADNSISSVILPLALPTSNIEIARHNPNANDDEKAILIKLPM